MTLSINIYNSAVIVIPTGTSTAYDAQSFFLSGRSRETTNHVMSNKIHAVRNMQKKRNNNNNYKYIKFSTISVSFPRLYSRQGVANYAGKAGTREKNKKSENKDVSNIRRKRRKWEARKRKWKEEKERRNPD